MPQPSARQLANKLPSNNDLGLPPVLTTGKGHPESHDGLRPYSRLHNQCEPSYIEGYPYHQPKQSPFVWIS